MRLEFSFSSAPLRVYSSTPCSFRAELLLSRECVSFEDLGFDNIIGKYWKWVLCIANIHIQGPCLQVLRRSMFMSFTMPDPLQKKCSWTGLPTFGYASCPLRVVIVNVCCSMLAGGPGPGRLGFGLGGNLGGKGIYYYDIISSYFHILILNCSVSVSLHYYFILML